MTIRNLFPGDPAWTGRENAMNSGPRTTSPLSLVEVHTAGASTLSLKTIHPTPAPIREALRPGPFNETFHTADASSTCGPSRVLMVVESAAGGTGRHVLDLCEGLIARGRDVHMIYSTGRIDQMFVDRMARISGLRTASLRLRTNVHPADAAAVVAIRRYAREHGPFDVIHGHSSKGGALARLAAVGTRARSFYTLHGFIIMDPGLALWKRGIYLSIELALGMVTKGIVAVSPEEARAAVRLGLGRSRVKVVPNGIGPIQLTPRAEARRTLGVADDATVVGFVGRLVDQKAPDVLLRGFAQASRTIPNARLTLAMVGSGPLDAPLRALADALGVGDRVLWLGERDARGLLSGFDLFALSSRKEGLPYVVIEAMAAGLPVVATRSAGVEILVDPGVTGIVVPPDDPDAFGEALAGLGGDPDRLARQGQAARARSARFTIDAMVEGTLAVYQGLTPPATSPVSHPSRSPSATT
ncbi:MAG: glycosyltransferase family 4 protein [Isosphaeraceae bacterium]